MKTEIVKVEPALQTNPIELVAVQADVLLARRTTVERVVRELMVEDVHYGAVPGVADSVMLDKAGSELLAATFQLAFDYEVTEHENAAGDRRYVSTCHVTHQPTGTALGSGMAECSTGETKFAWRRASGKTEYDQAPEDRRREKTYYKKGGSSYVVQQVRELTDDKGNTALKMANKRAASDAVQAVLGVRGMILQGVTPGKGQNAANAVAKLAGEEAVAELVRFAALKGIAETRLLRILKKDVGYSGRLADISSADYGYLAGGLFALPDKVDPVTGEVAEEAASDTEPAQDDDAIGFEGEDAPGTDGEAPGHDAASFKAKNAAAAAKPTEAML